MCNHCAIAVYVRYERRTIEKGKDRIMSLTDVTVVECLLRSTAWVRDVEALQEQVYRLTYLDDAEEMGKLPVTMYVDGNLVEPLWSLLAPVQDLQAALQVTGVYPVGLVMVGEEQAFLRFSLWKEWSEPLALTNGISFLGYAHNMYQQNGG